MPKKEIKNQRADLSKIPSKSVYSKNPDTTSEKSPVSIYKKDINISPEKTTGNNIERILVENFVSLQKVMVNLSIKLDGLTNQISQLLNLFEISAKALAEKNINLGGDYEKRIMEKIDNLADQNKTIARGIALLHEGTGQNLTIPQRTPLPKAYPKQENLSEEPLLQKGYEQNEAGDYQKSISSRPQKFNQLPKG